ncbi:MAG: YheT family hydrolase [Neisseriaceae bacterium]
MKTTNFLSNSHLNTILPIYLAQNIDPNYVRERINTPDGDFIDFDWVNKDIVNKPTVILFHGTEGNSKSQYAKRIMHYLAQIGWRGVVPHFRGCSGEINLNLRYYHAGETEDVAWIINTIKQRTTSNLFTIGVSIGGNILLKYLGEAGSLSQVTAAIALSTPFDLNETAQKLKNGFNKYVYTRSFLNSLLPKMKEYASRFENFNYIDKKVDTLDEFNDLYLCQVTDFKNAKDYYNRTSCKQFLKYITTHTMILQSQDDPMVPICSWPTRAELSTYIKFVGTKTGGHAGFVTLDRNYKTALLKLPKFLVDYFNHISKIANFTNTSSTN